MSAVCVQETCRLIRQPGTDDCSPVLIISGATVGAHIHSHGALPGVTLWPRFENPRLLDVTLQGPAGTPYEGGCCGHCVHSMAHSVLLYWHVSANRGSFLA